MRRGGGRAAALLLAAAAPLAIGAGPAATGRWPFASPLGSFPPAELARGLDAFRRDCAGCHGIGDVRIRDLASLGFTRAQALALAGGAAGGGEAPAVPTPPGASARIPPDAASAESFPDAASAAMPADAARGAALADALPPEAGAADAMRRFLLAGHAGAPAVDGGAADAIVTFLAAVARPHLAQRRRLGVGVLVFLACLAAIVAWLRASEPRPHSPGPPG